MRRAAALTAWALWLIRLRWGDGPAAELRAALEEATAEETSNIVRYFLWRHPELAELL